jgi:Icc-related predicted phosphoesterase
MIRVAAVGDLHLGRESHGALQPHLMHLGDRADVLIIAGDLTQHGTVEEGQILAEELAGCAVPVVAVLGNHDYHAGQEDEIRRLLEDAGVRVLECEAIVLELHGSTLGLVGTKGFGGGFAGACGTEFGEPEMKAFIRHTKQIAERFDALLAGLSTDLRVAVTHYAPSKSTLLGEKLEIYPWLGSYLLGEAIDHARCDLALHGHAHHGTEHGVTPGGVPVRNVALPVIKVSYNVYTFGLQRPIAART